MQLKMNDHRAHLSAVGAPAWLYDQGDEGAETSVRPDLTEGEPREGESEKKGDTRVLSREVYTSTDPTLKTVQPVQITLGISGW